MPWTVAFHPEFEPEFRRLATDVQDELLAQARSGLDEVKGAYISYDAVNEKYLVTTAAGANKSATGAGQARVRAIIQPKNKSDESADRKGEPLALKPAAKLTPRSDE